MSYLPAVPVRRALLKPRNRSIVSPRRPPSATSDYPADNPDYRSDRPAMISSAAALTAATTRIIGMHLLEASVPLAEVKIRTQVEVDEHTLKRYVGRYELARDVVLTSSTRIRDGVEHREVDAQRQGNDLSSDAQNSASGTSVSNIRSMYELDGLSIGRNPHQLARAD